MYEQRAYPNDKIPEDAYRKAWDYIQQMQQAQPPPVPTPSAEPLSWLAGPRAWLSRAWDLLTPRPALAQIPPEYEWYQIGPAPLISASNNNAGLIAAIGLDPSDPFQTAYVGTFGGGVWKTTNAFQSGTTWTPITDTQPSLQLQAVAVHPGNWQIVFVGSGQYNGLTDPNAPERSIGLLRSTDAGSTWCQIGPLCTDATHCPGSNPDYTTSNLTVAEVAVENVGPSYRVWAATSKGLWFSDNAASQPSVAACTQVTWTQASIPAGKNDGVTPDTFNHVFLSPSNSQVLYANIVGSDTSPSHNGWWKTTNHNTSWTQVKSLPNGDGFGRAAIRNWQSGPDVIWGLVGGPSYCSGTGGQLYRTTDSGVSWTLLNLKDNLGRDISCSQDYRSVAIDPSNPATVIALGSVELLRSTNGTAPGTPGSEVVFQSVGNGTLHVDHNALRFAYHDVLFDGNDGGMWLITNFSTGPVYKNLNTNLANTEFNHGTIDPLNYGVSLGGTQDNGTLRGGAPLSWNQLQGGDTSGQIVIDPTNSNYAYCTNFQENRGPYRTTDGGLNWSVLSSGLPTPAPGGGAVDSSLSMDPSPNGGNTTVALFFSDAVPTPQGQKVYRTTNANGAAAWQSITNDTGRPGNTLPVVHEIAIAPLAASQPAPSNKIFGATWGDGLWCTNDANRWRGGRGAAGAPLPNLALTSVAITTSQCSPTQQPCTATCPCTLYVSLGGFDANSGHVYRSTNYTGQDCNTLSWENVSGTVEACAGGVCPNSGRPCVNNACPYYLPNIPADKVVVDGANPDLLYLATDMGIFQGCHVCKSVDLLTCNPSGTNFICNASATAWVWDKLTQGFPQAAWVTDLTLHHDSRVLRAWTYGRSVWEANLAAATIPNPDRQVNTTEPVTDVQPPQISSRTAAGSGYAITWADDRNGANNWHVQYRGFNPDGTPMSSPDVRVDDTSTHVAQAPAVADLTHQSYGECSWVVWHDDRLNPVNHYNHLFYTQICSSGYKPFADMRLDSQPTNPNLNATYPAVVKQPTVCCLASVAAWQADRTSVPNPLHDIYIRRFSGYGLAQGPLQVNATSSTSDATFPALAADGNNNTYVAWEEYEPGPSPPKEHKIFLSKYDVYLGLAHSPIRIDSQLNPSTTDRDGVAVAVDNQTGGNGPTVIVSWYEATGGPEYVVRRRLQIPSSSSYVFLDDPPFFPVNDPPLAPAGVQRAGFPSVATDASNNFLIAWQANVNASNPTPNPTPTPNWNLFGKSYNANATPTPLKRDFRIDLAGRALTGAPRVASSSLAGKFAYAWRDNRVNHPRPTPYFDVYTRVVPSM